MKTRNHRLLVFCLLCLGLVNLGKGQAFSQQLAPQDSPDRVRGESQFGMSREEKLVRTTYDKLATYNKATRIRETEDGNKSRDSNLSLNFELKNFRTGPVQDISGVLHRDLVSLPTGDIIEISSGTTTHNNGEPQVIYRAQWVNGQYASIYDRNWTVGDLLGFYPLQYYDVKRYTSYEVTVSFEGKTRTYRALALFHSSGQGAESLEPSIWDSVVGAGGILTNVWKEKRPPVTKKPSSSVTKGTAGAAASSLATDIMKSPYTKSAFENKTRTYPTLALVYNSHQGAEYLKLGLDTVSNSKAEFFISKGVANSTLNASPLWKSLV
ncbi:MAG: hypothetical protein ABR577_01015 [Pyrinomonadaceae bacterium]